MDFRTGKIVPGYLPPVSDALPTYVGLLQQYPYLEAGFELPNPVPPDLLMPFGQLAEKYSLGSIVPLLFSYGQGLGDLLRLPSLYVMKAIGLSVVDGILRSSFVTAERGDNSELYEKAAAELGADVLFGSRVAHLDRGTNAGHLITVRTPAGIQRIRAKKLVLSIPPLLSNLRGFDLDGAERGLFGQFRHAGYFTGLARLRGVPGNLTIQNVGADTPYHLPALPGVYSLRPTAIPGLHDVKYGTTSGMTLRAASARILADLCRLSTAGTFPDLEPELTVFKSHTPFQLTVGAAEVANGFYRDLNALQGRRRTYYTGAAFHTHDSTLLWQFTESLLARITADR